MKTEECYIWKDLARCDFYLADVLIGGGGCSASGIGGGSGDGLLTFSLRNSAHKPNILQLCKFLSDFDT